MQSSRVVTALIAALPALILSATPAKAMWLNQEGTGQVLLYPYYTVNAGNLSMISVVNATNTTKVAKVRFREAYNGQEVFAVDVFLSPYDVWTSNVFALNATGGANLLTDDESCTIPDIKNASGPGVLNLPPPDGRSFLPFRSANYQTDGGPSGITRTREGHLEILEMATIPYSSPIATAVIHDDGIPAGCDGLAAIFEASQNDLVRPTGGLYGSANIVDPESGAMISYNAEAIDGFYRLLTPLYSNRNAGPTLADARTTSTTTMSSTFAQSTVEQTTDVMTATYPSTRAIDAVSSLFAADSLSNDYRLDSNAGLESEWVITFPTKHHYVNRTPAIAPFPQRFAAPGKSCVIVSYVYFDREERLFEDPASCGEQCPPVEPMKLCTQTQVLTFQTAADYASHAGVSTVLGSTLTVNVDPRTDAQFGAGWLRLNLDDQGREPHAMRPSMESYVFLGLPVTGFLATNQTQHSHAAPNLLSDYATTSRHRLTRDCISITAPTGWCAEEN